MTVSFGLLVSALYPGGLLTVADGAVSFLSPPTRFAILNAEALDDRTGRGALAAGAAGAVAPGVGDLGDGLGPPALLVGVGLGVTVSRDDPGDKDGEGDVVKSILYQSISESYV